MTEIIFAKTRYEYGSYTDFWRLVELSGFPTVYLDELDYGADVTYIAAPFNGEFFAIPKERKCKVYLWNLERPGPGTVEEYWGGNQNHIHEGHIDKVIVSDAQLAQQTGFHHIPLGSHPDFGEPGNLDDKIYDYIHLMCYSLRRSQFFDYLTPKTRYHDMLMAPNGWGKERDESLKRGRVMLSIHQDDHLYIEPLRYAIAAAYGLPVLTEYVSPLSSEFYFGGIFVMAPGISNYEVPMQNIIMKYEEVCIHAGKKLQQLLTKDFTFRKCIEKFL